MSKSSMPILAIVVAKLDEFELRQCDGSGAYKNSFKTLYRGLL